MPPRPKTDSSAEVAALVMTLATMTRGQPVLVGQVARMLETDSKLRACYDAYHARLDLTLAHSELSVTDALRRLEGYDDGRFVCKRLRQGHRTHWIFAPRPDVTARAAYHDNLSRIADALERLVTAAERANQLNED